MTVSEGTQCGRGVLLQFVRACWRLRPLRPAGLHIHLMRVLVVLITQRCPGFGPWTKAAAEI
jgi:hypothetical protein